MRIVLLSSAYAPSIGGVEVLTHRLAVNLRLAGHQVEVWTACSADDDLPRSDTIDDVPVRRFVFAAPRLHLGSTLRWPATARATYNRMRRAVREFEPDVLNVQCFSGNGAYATALSFSTKIPLVVTLHGETVMDDHDIYEHSSFLRMALRLGLRQASWVTGCSQFTLDDALRFGLDPAKSEVIFNGIDEHEATPKPVQVPFDRYVLGLGRFVHKKGFDLLVEGFARVSGDAQALGLVLVGQGAARAAVEQQVERLGLRDRVHFTGALDRGQVAAVMSGAEVFVMPSRVEPFGIVALEAWRAGTPVVVSSSGGASEFVRDQADGYVVDPTDTDALAAALRQLIASPDLRRQFAAAGRRRVSEFSWDRQTARYESVYERVTGVRQAVR